MKKIISLIVILIVVVVFISLMFDWGRKTNLPELNLNATTTEIADSNSTSTSNISEMPIVVNIKDNQTVSNPIMIEGKARGNWFFEASFPIQLVDTNGNLIASTIGRADGDWMTTDYVKFTATLEYNKSTSTDRALLILSNDNPSGNPELSKSIFIPVILK